MPVAHRVRTLREGRGISLRALADAPGLSPATLTQIQQGQASPSVATLERLAYGLRIPMAAFFDEVAEGHV
jgi:transcriptional regulator with XRE-family HTH domain